MLLLRYFVDVNIEAQGTWNKINTKQQQQKNHRGI